MSTAIEFSHVSKQYRLGLVSTKTLSHDIRRFWITNVLGKEDPYLKIGETNDRASKGNSEYVWALRDIDFKVEQGDVVGIIGKNGAGKSTLLKLLSRVTGPTTGTIRAHGRIGSLLEVGTGFHGEMTGRENIFMNGAILGMSRSEIQSKLDEIIDFSGCERYIDTPVKRYSSGMTVRLGFAVAAFLEPEILVVDEVLAVGDAEFQKKAIGKMKDVSQGQGRTVLFVSHNMQSVKNLCKTGVWLKNGMICQTGTAEDMVRNYLSEDLPKNQSDMTCNSDFIGHGDIRIGKVDIHSRSQDTGYVDNSEETTLEFEVINPNHYSGSVEVAGVIKTIDGDYVTYFSSRLVEKLYYLKETDDKIVVKVVFKKLPLVARKYVLGFELKLNGTIVYYLERGMMFDVLDSDYFNCGFVDDNGMLLLNQEWE